MREIKFRGQCMTSGEMVFGDLIHGVGWKKDHVYILPDATNLAHVKHCDPLDGVRVIPESVGQFTGLPDKNAGDIYEGDILKRTITISGNSKEYIEKVICKPGYFATVNINEGADSAIYLTTWQFHVIEVLGNIHEHPSLLTTTP